MKLTGVVRWLLFRFIGGRWYPRPTWRLDPPRYRAYHLQRISRRRTDRHLAFYRSVQGPITRTLPVTCETCGELLTLTQLDLSEILAFEPAATYQAPERTRYHSAKGCPITEIESARKP